MALQYLAIACANIMHMLNVSIQHLYYSLTNPLEFARRLSIKSAQV